MLQMSEQLSKEEEKKYWDEQIRFAFWVFLAAIFIRTFIAQPFIVSGSSMLPSFHSRDYLIVDEISYKLSEPKRLEVVVFKYPNDIKKFYIKRIIGLPNETVIIKENEVTIINQENRDGFKLNEPYVKNLAYDDITYELGENEYFVLGDNRSASSDSRSWGAVPKKLLIGKAFLRLYPINKIGVLPGGHKNN
jgi:signal peptidase I